MEYDEQLEKLIRNALEEDMGDGDHSTLSAIEPAALGKAALKIKQEGIMAGMAVAEKIFKQIQPDIQFHPFLNDGQQMTSGDTGFLVEGTVHTLLKGERLVLNCLQRMSGIATLTHQFVGRLKGFHTRLLDTRKTTPNFRLLEKEAVRIGGGFNHRFGLYDMIMLKDNHIDFCGGIEKAIEKAYAYVQGIRPGLKIEVETRNLEEVKRVVRTGKVDRIMLDNFTPKNIVAALEIIGGRFETEASGGIDLSNIETYAATGVDFISSGAIIHQARSLDLSLKASIQEIPG